MSLPFKIYIRTTLQRTLHPSIARELGTNYTLLVDYNHDPVGSFISQLQEISSSPALLLEDDVILCHGFLQEIEKAVSLYPSFVINFFTKPFDYFTTHIEFAHFVYNQCTYYPQGVSKKIADRMILINDHRAAYDVLQNRAMTNLSIPYVIWRPCPVQHLDLDTLISESTSHRRRTRFFKDYLDELGITMEEAYLYFYQLDKILKREFEQLDMIIDNKKSSNKNP